MLCAPIKHFPFNTWDAFYFIIFIHALCNCNDDYVIFHCYRRNSAHFFHAEILMFGVKTCETGMFLFLIYITHLSHKFLTSKYLSAEL